MALVDFCIMGVDIDDEEASATTIAIAGYDRKVEEVMNLILGW